MHRSQLRRLRALGLAAGVAAAGCALTTRASAEPAVDYYVDARRQRVPFTPTYESWFGAERYEPNYVRAIAENSAMLLLEVVIYWYDPSINAADWQFPDLGSKLTTSEAFRFDDNLLRTNYLHHPAAGTMHYLLTRTNGFGVFGSFVAAAGSSALYELVLEWRELVSINDLIVTPIGGMAAGEFFHQLGNYLDSEPPRVRTDVRQSLGALARGGARVTLGAPRAFHDALDDPEPPVAVAADNLGLSSAYSHAFRVRFGQDTVARDASFDGGYSFSTELELAAMPGFQRPGNFSRWFHDGNFTSLQARIGFGGAGRDAELFVDSHLFGFYAQDISASGHAHELAVATGLRYVDRRLLMKTDQYGIVHLPHPTGRFWLHLGAARLELAADLSPDFGSLYSAAYEGYRARFGTEGTKSSLKSHGYVHALGVSGGVSASLSAGAFELGGRARHGRYESIGGLERYQEDVTRDAHASETITDLAAHIRLEPPGTVLSTRFELTEVRRGSTLDSSLGEFGANRAHQRMSVELGVRF